MKAIVFSDGTVVFPNSELLLQAYKVNMINALGVSIALSMFNRSHTDEVWIQAINGRKKAAE